MRYNQKTLKMALRHNIKELISVAAIRGLIPLKEIEEVKVILKSPKFVVVKTKTYLVILRESRKHNTIVEAIPIWKVI